MSNRRVLILGAGPTGLMLALWLTRLGVRVRIIDKTAEPGTTSRKDNFAPLASLTWQVYVYGEPQSGVAETCADLQLPLHAVAWHQRMRRADLLWGALYPIRPDGYVALPDPRADPGQLLAYLREGVVARLGTLGGQLIEQRQAGLESVLTTGHS